MRADLLSLMQSGIAFHHAALTFEEKEFVEYFFRKSLVKLLYCTTTLAAGVNLPAHTVVITSTKQGVDNLSSMSYKQMVGRAGRYGLDSEGQAFLLARENDKRAAFRYLKCKLERTESRLLHDGDALQIKSLILDSVGSKLVKNDIELKEFLECTLAHVQV